MPFFNNVSEQFRSPLLKITQNVSLCNMFEYIATRENNLYLAALTQSEEILCNFVYADDCCKVLIQVILILNRGKNCDYLFIKWRAKYSFSKKVKTHANAKANAKATSVFSSRQ